MYLGLFLVNCKLQCLLGTVRMIQVSGRKFTFKGPASMSPSALPGGCVGWPDTVTVAFCCWSLAWKDQQQGFKGPRPGSHTP